MLKIRKSFVTDINKNPIAVQIDIRTFEKIEQLLEDYALGQLIEENDPSEYLSVADAKGYYVDLVRKDE
jgi:hypothetical protein